jgi:Na+-driven multidrug efflux pump
MEPIWLVLMRAQVMLLTSQAVPMLAVSLIGEGANTVLAGVLRGCGRQKIGATINLIAYWGIGLPVSCVLAFKMGLGAMGLWTGLACTASLQSLYLSAVVFRWAVREVCVYISLHKREKRCTHTHTHTPPQV